MKRLLLITMLLLCSLGVYADNDGDFLDELTLVEQPSRSPVIYPDAYITLGDLYVEAAQSTVDVRIYTESGSTPVLSSSNYGQVVVDLDDLQPGTYILVIDANGRQFEATFAVFTTE